MWGRRYREEEARPEVMSSRSGAGSGDPRLETRVPEPAAEMQVWSWAVLAFRGTMKQYLAQVEGPISINIPSYPAKKQKRVRTESTLLVTLRLFL